MELKDFLRAKEISEELDAFHEERERIHEKERLLGEEYDTLVGPNTCGHIIIYKGKAYRIGTWKINPVDVISWEEE